MAIQGGSAVSSPPAAEPPAPAPLPILGSLPAVRYRRWRRDAGDARSVFQSQSHLVDVIDKPQASFAGAVAAIRRELAGSGRDRRILILGLQPQAGTTTLALNLALDAARSGQSALLVDAGEGSLGLSRIFASDAPAGLGEVLAGKLAFGRAILKDEGTGLTFLPRGDIASAVPAAIQSELFGAARRFGPTVIDGGSLRPDGLALRFAEKVDDIVLVARGGALAPAEFDAWRKQLGAQAGKLRGIVLNAA